MLAFLPLPHVLVGQAQESSDAHLRNNCRLAGQVLSTGQPSTHRDWAMGYISRCQTSGPAVLAQLWSAAPGTSDALREIEVPIAQLRDARIATVLMQTARDRSAPDLKRVVALKILSYYAAPMVGMPLSALLDSRPDSVRSLELVGGDHDTALPGSEPLSPTIRVDVQSLLRELVAGDADSVVGRAADRLLKYVVSDA